MKIRGQRFTCFCDFTIITITRQCFGDIDLKSKFRDKNFSEVLKNYSKEGIAFK